MKYTDATILRALELRAAGQTYAEIKAATGISIGYQHRIYTGHSRRGSATRQQAKMLLAEKLVGATGKPAMLPPPTKPSLPPAAEPPSIADIVGMMKGTNHE